MAKKSSYEAILDAIKDSTSEWDKESYAVDTKQSEKAKKLSKLLSELSGIGKEDKSRLASVFSEVSGEDVVIEKDEELNMNVALLALVITKNATDNDRHTYELGKLVITTGDGAAIAEDGKAGSLIPAKRQFVRPATDKEIENISESHVKAFKKETGLIIVG